MAAGYERYGDLKKDAAAAVVEMLAPLQARYAELDADRGSVLELLARGAAAAREVADATYERAASAVGLLPPVR